MSYLPSYMQSQTLNIGLPYHPQVNFSIILYQLQLMYRFNQTLSRCLEKVIDDDHCNWEEKIDMVLMGYRASRQASTKHSPYFMLSKYETIH